MKRLLIKARKSGQPVRKGFVPPEIEFLTGFTLMELTVVIIILGVVAALALPNLSIQMRRVRNREAEGILLALFEAQMTHHRETGSYVVGDDTQLANLDVDINMSAVQNFTNLQFYNATTKLCGGVPPNLLVLASLDSVEGGEGTANGYTLYVLERNALVVCFPCDPTGGGRCEKMGYNDSFHLCTAKGC